MEFSCRSLIQRFYYKPTIAVHHVCVCLCAPARTPIVWARRRQAEPSYVWRVPYLVSYSETQFFFSCPNIPDSTADEFIIRHNSSTHKYWVGEQSRDRVAIDHSPTHTFATRFRVMWVVKKKNIYIYITTTQGIIAVAAKIVNNCMTNLVLIGYTQLLPPQQTHLECTSESHLTIWLWVNTQQS